jgi:hypothetical protein
MSPTAASSEAALPLAALSQLMAALRHKSACFVQHMHPDWIEAALPGRVKWALSQAGGAHGGRVSMLLAKAYGVGWPDLCTLQHRAHRVALLPMPACKQVLATVALYAQRGSVRRCVGRTARLNLVTMVGEPAYWALVKTTETDTQAVDHDVAHRSLEDCAAEGYRLLHDNGLWTCKKASLITRLTLARDALSDTPRPARALPHHELGELLGRLDQFFPEQSWLFGSDMDRALSA